MKKTFLVIVSVIVSVCAMAQDRETATVHEEEVDSATLDQNKLNAFVSADIVSSYLWRGGKLDNAAIQPTLGIEWKGLSLSAWGSYGLSGRDDAVKEIDLTLGYSIGNFNVGITDYWSCTEDNVKYFEYKNDETSHVFEANIGYDFGFLSAQWFTNFAGADGLRCNGKRAYLSYFELTAPFKLGGIDWAATVGAVPYSAYAGWEEEGDPDPETGEPTYTWGSYYDTNSCNFAVTNVTVRAEKAIKITKGFELPLFAQLTANPSSQKMYFAFGFTLKP